MKIIKPEFVKDILQGGSGRIIRYIAVGAATTGVSFGGYALLLYLNLHPNAANAISVAAAVIFAYAANKLFVFKSRCGNLKELAAEAMAFFASRAVSMLAEVGGVFVLYSILHAGAMLSKVLVSVLVLVLNYVFAHLLFTRKNTKG